MKIGNIFGHAGGSFGGNVYDVCSLAPTLNTMGGGDTQPMITEPAKGGLDVIDNGYRIRKLTPRECWRLMGFDDEAFDKAVQVNSNTQLYKQVGNSIVVDVLMAIFENLLMIGK